MKKLPVRFARKLPFTTVRSFHRTMPSNLRERSVVSSFICTAPQLSGGVTFALFKRSQDVSSYPGKWAVCSGSIDPLDASPEAAARREILEETTLADNDISLLRQGKPFSLTDEKLQTRWTIYPFGWQLKEGAKAINFDWEHTEYQFIRPEDLKNYDHVPQLEVGLRRVLVSPEAEDGLAVLRDDHESGARALALKSMDILLRCIQGNEIAKLSTSEEFWQELRWTAWHLAKNGRPSMGAAIEAELFRILDILRQERNLAKNTGRRDIQLATFKSIAEIVVEGRIKATQYRLQDLADVFVRFVETNLHADWKGDLPSSTNIVTLSSSGTITLSLASLIESHAKKGINIKISVLESRPKFEGVSFVSTLLRLCRKDPNILSRLKVEIVVDAQIATVVRDADFIVLGADKVIPNGDVSNKIGSLTAAVVAKALNPACKVLAIFETAKIASPDLDSNYLKVEYNDEAEITNVWLSTCARELKVEQARGFQVEVKNAYFEWVAAEYIDHYISEEGPLQRDDIARLAAESDALEKRLFSDL